MESALVVKKSQKNYIYLLAVKRKVNNFLYLLFDVYFLVNQFDVSRWKVEYFLG